MKLTINIPETLNEVTLKQYQKWLKIAEGKELDSFLQQKMVEIFCNIPLKQVLQIKATLYQHATFPQDEFKINM